MTDKGYEGLKIPKSLIIWHADPAVARKLVEKWIEFWEKSDPIDLDQLREDILREDKKTYQTKLSDYYKSR